MDSKAKSSHVCIINFQTIFKFLAPRNFYFVFNFGEEAHKMFLMKLTNKMAAKYKVQAKTLFTGNVTLVFVCSLLERM